MWSVVKTPEAYLVQSKATCCRCLKKKTIGWYGVDIPTSKSDAEQHAATVNERGGRPELAIDVRPTGLGCDHKGNEFVGRRRDRNHKSSEG